MRINRQGQVVQQRQGLRGSSSVTEAATSSCITPPFRATGSAHSKKARRSSSKSSTAQGPAGRQTSRRSSHIQGLGLGLRANEAFSTEPLALLLALVSYSL